MDRRIDSVYLITSLGHAMFDIADWGGDADPVRLCRGIAGFRVRPDHARGMTGDDAPAFIYRVLIEAAHGDIAKAHQMITSATP